MNHTINVPFSKFVFINANKKHAKYFDTQFIKTTYKTPLAFEIETTFTPIELTYFRSLEGTFFAEANRFYVADIKGKLASVDFLSLHQKVVRVEADPDFDLYYLYSFVLEPLYIVKAASKNILLLHASAVASPKVGAIVFTAWRHTGKTDSILHLAHHGYRFLGDDFCVIHNKTVYLYPKKINLFSYNLTRFPSLFSSLPSQLKIRLFCTLAFKNLLSYIAEHTGGGVSKVFYRIAQLAEVSTNIKINPKTIDIRTASSASLKTVLSLEKMSVKEDNLLISINGEDLQRKISSILMYELADFFHYYQAFQYFYPSKRSPVVDKYLENVVQLVQKYIAQSYTYQLTAHGLVEPEVLKTL